MARYVEVTIKGTYEVLDEEGYPEGDSPAVVDGDEYHSGSVSLEDVLGWLDRLDVEFKDA